MFEVKKLSAAYGKEEILRDVAFSLRPGTITGLIGTNGSGKTTLLKSICGILPHGGSCSLDGVVLEELSAKKLAQLVGYIPQRSGITIDLTAREVALMGCNPHLGLLQQPTPEMHQAADRALEEMGIDPEKNYLHLSEGQKQLCMLARAKAGGGRLLLMDEPESALDVKNRYGVFRAMKTWMGERMVLAALHDPQLALQVCDTMILLNNKTIETVLHPKTDELCHMEQALGKLYGQVTLHRVDGKIVMIL